VFLVDQSTNVNSSSFGDLSLLDSEFAASDSVDSVSSSTSMDGNLDTVSDWSVNFLGQVMECTTSSVSVEGCLAAVFNNDGVDSLAASSEVHFSPEMSEYSWSLFLEGLLCSSEQFGSLVEWSSGE
jgi:hypothetical protein